jgi:hypothetical protein
MAISTYAELKQAIINWSKRQDNDVSSVLDDFIDLAEADIWQRLRIREMETRSTANTTATRFYSLPTGYQEMRRIKLDRSDKDVTLEFETPFNLKIIESSGTPKNYTITSQIELDRVPDATYTIEYQYYASLTALSNSNTTNAVLTRFPTVYLYACLFHYGQWAQDDEFMAKYATLAEGAINAANENDKRGRYGPGKAAKAQGSTP